MFVYYNIVKSYKGIFKKRHIGNNHLILFPTPTKYHYIMVLGEVISAVKTTWAAELLAIVSPEYIEKLFKIENDHFKDRYVRMEKIPCISTKKDEDILVKLKKKGQYLLTNFKVMPKPDLSDKKRKIVFIEGNFRFFMSELTPDQINSASSLKKAFLGKTYQKFKK